MTTEHAESFKKLVPRSAETLTPDEMIELCMLHELFEFDNDIDGIMSTLIDTPVYELYPQGVRISGVHAVRLFYERTLWIFRQLDSRAKDVETRRIISIGFGDTHLAAELSDDLEFPDGTRRRVQTLAVVEFRGDLMVGERLYFDHALASLIDQSLGEDFFARPDVTTPGG
jgi:hypothetical protein